MKTCDDAVDNVDAIVGPGMALIKVHLDNDPGDILMATGILISHNLVLTAAHFLRYVIYFNDNNNNIVLTLA